MIDSALLLASLIKIRQFIILEGELGRFRHIIPIVEIAPNISVTSVRCFFSQDIIAPFFTQWDIRKGDLLFLK
jgi:hypothetical protein